MGIPRGPLKKKRRKQRKKAKTIAARQAPQRATVLEQLTEGATLTNACQQAGINLWTLTSWRKKSKAFDEQVMRAMASNRKEMVHDALYVNAVNRMNVIAQIAWLKINDPQAREALTQVAVGDGKGGPVKLEHTLAGLMKAALNGNGHGGNGTGGGNGNGRKDAGRLGEALRVSPAEGGTAGALRGVAGVGAGGSHNRLPAGAGQQGAEPGPDKAGRSGALGERGDRAE